MKCAEFEERLLDEDGRAALRGRGPIPAALAAHMAGCPACAREFEAAERDLVRFADALMLTAPPLLRARLRRRAAEILPGDAHAFAHWREPVAWAAAAGALFAGAATFFAPGAVGLVAEAGSFVLGASVAIGLRAAALVFRMRLLS